MKWMIVIAAALIIALLVAANVAYYSTAEWVTVTITDKERITTGSGESIRGKFIVYAEGEVFENTDSILFMKFNSADFQNRLKVGGTYNVKVVGWRVPFFSMYRNIVEVGV